MANTSAGLLVFRESAGTLEVLLVHPGGPFWARKDDGAWTIPKGEIELDEVPLQAARREFTEETGFESCGPYTPLEPVRQPGGKIVLAWACRGNADPAKLVSNHFSMEWPPRSGRHREFPEIDRAGWFVIPVAHRKILKGQRALLDQLTSKLHHAAEH